MSNITDATCDFGLAQTAAGCVRTLASYNPSRYFHVQIAYCAVGLVTMLASVIMYLRSIKHDGSKLQRYNFLFCCYASATVVFRGADPHSYGHIIPRPIGSFLSDSCTASLYSVYILTLGYWATIIQSGAAVTERPAHLKCLENTAIVVVWTFYLLYDMCLFLSKGFNPQGITYLTMTVSACMLGIISTVFLIYGLRVLSRLQEYERQRKLRQPSILSDRMMAQSFNMELSEDEDGLPVVSEPRRVQRRPRKGHAVKIRNILLIAESLSLLVIAGQMYIAVTHTAEMPATLLCANGIDCDTVKSSVSILHVFQVICIYVILWTFRNVQKKEVVPEPQRGY